MEDSQQGEAEGLMLEVKRALSDAQFTIFVDKLSTLSHEQNLEETRRVVAKMKSMLTGRNELWERVTAFFPATVIDSIDAAADDNANVLASVPADNGSLDFATLIETRCSQEVSDQFRFILVQRSSNECQWDEACVRVFRLFSNSPELLDRFSHFLPGEAKVIWKKTRSSYKKLTAGDSPPFSAEGPVSDSLYAAIRAKLQKKLKKLEKKRERREKKKEKREKRSKKRPREERPSDDDGSEENGKEEKEKEKEKEKREQAKRRRVDEERRDDSESALRGEERDEEEDRGQSASKSWMNIGAGGDTGRSRRAAAETALNRMTLFDHDFDLTQFKFNQQPRKSPSYVILPTHAKRFHATALLQEAEHIQGSLNSDYMICPSQAIQRHDDSRVNPHAEVTFILEQDQLELDVNIERLRSAIQRFQSLLEFMQMPGWDEDSFDLNAYIGPVHKVVIKATYSRQGFEKLDLLCIDPVTVAPDILLALQTRLNELIAIKNRLNQKWRLALAEHVVPALNVRGAIAKRKADDKRQPEALLAELRKAHLSRHPTASADLHFSLPALDVARTSVLLSDLAGLILASTDVSPFVAFKDSFFKLLLPFPGDVARASVPFDIFLALRYLQLFVLRYQSLGPLSEFDARRFDWSLARRPAPTSSTASWFMTYDQLSDSPKLTISDDYCVGPDLVAPKKRITAVTDLIHQFCLGQVEQSRYEERCMRLLGPGAFVLFDCDKLLVLLLRQLRHISAHPLLRDSVLAAPTSSSFSSPEPAVAFQFHSTADSGTLGLTLLDQ